MDKTKFKKIIGYAFLAFIFVLAVINLFEIFNPKIDCAKYMEYQFLGNDGEGYLYLGIDSSKFWDNGAYINEDTGYEIMLMCSSAVADKTTGLSNGDVITVCVPKETSFGDNTYFTTTKIKVKGLKEPGTIWR